MGNNQEMDFFKEIILDQIERHSPLLVQDIYKLVHQAAFGPDHAREDGESQELERDSRRGERIGKKERLLEWLDPWGELLRIHLRLFEKSGGRLRELSRMFQDSIRLFKGDQDKFQTMSGWLLQFADEGSIPFTREEIEIFWKSREKEKYAPVHHSDVYVNANQPCYRVILRSVWEERPKRSAVSEEKKHGGSGEENI